MRAAADREPRRFVRIAQKLVFELKISKSKREVSTSNILKQSSLQGGQRIAVMSCGSNFVRRKESFK
jgi:hypothetical protein